MSKCNGKNCPMQVGFDVANCKQEECAYRTEPDEYEEYIEKVCAGIKIIIKTYLSEN